MQERIFEVSNLADTDSAGAEIASQLVFPSCVYLKGEMGAGKTTLTKSIIRALGHAGDVTSPTYNLIQEYAVEQGTVYHMDLYRLEDPGELEYLAVEDLWSDSSLFLIEWPEKGAGYLREANSLIEIKKLCGKSESLRQIMLQNYN